MHKSEDAAFVGIDWADKKHDICLWVPGQEKRERLVLEHRPEDSHAWARQLRERFGGAAVAVSVELREGPIVWALLEHDVFVLFPVPRTTVARYRSAFRPSGAKDDPTDAEVILKLLVRHRNKLQQLQPERAVVRPLRRLVEGGARRTLACCLHRPWHELGCASGAVHLAQSQFAKKPRRNRQNALSE
jgi:hypothetical protein